MDADRFDTVARLIVSRRSGLALATGLLLGVASAPEARGKHKRKHRKRKTCPSGQKRCGTVCIPTTGCCGDAECTNGRVCQGGTCGCASGTTTCPDRCCQAAPGFVARSVACGAGSCSCDYQIADNPGKCPAGCVTSCGVTTDCATPGKMCDTCCP